MHANKHELPSGVVGVLSANSCQMIQCADGTIMLPLFHRGTATPSAETELFLEGRWMKTINGMAPRKQINKSINSCGEAAVSERLLSLPPLQAFTQTNGRAAHTATGTVNAV